MYICVCIVVFNDSVFDNKTRLKWKIVVPFILFLPCFSLFLSLIYFFFFLPSSILLYFTFFGVWHGVRDPFNGDA